MSRHEHDFGPAAVSAMNNHPHDLHLDMKRFHTRHLKQSATCV